MSVTAADVTVDLNGYTVRGVLIDAHRVTVKNGTIAPSPGNMAVYIIGSDALLERVEVVGGGGFVVEAGPRTTVRHSTFRANTGIAIDQYYGSALTVEHTTFVDNRVGVSVQNGRGAVIENNRFANNFVGVNIWDEDGGGASDTHVLDNMFTGNNVGVRVRGMHDASGTVIEDNKFEQSGSSAVLVTTAYEPGQSYFDSPGGAAGTIIRDNVVLASGDTPQDANGCRDELGYPQCETVADDGITVLSLPEIAATMTVARNKAIKNEGYGIEAPGVTDGGGNVAAQNDAGDCVGVVCR